MSYSTEVFYVVGILLALLTFNLGIKKIIDTRRRKELITEVERLHDEMRSRSILTIQHKKRNFPLFLAEKKLHEELNKHLTLRNRLKSKWRAHYANLSWWGKMTQDVGLNIDDQNELVTTELDHYIESTEAAIAQFNKRYKNDILSSNAYFRKLDLRAFDRLRESKESMIKKVNDLKITEIDRNFIAASWLAGLLIPTSITNDLMSSNAIYDSLRSVNKNFEGLSDTEIWWETLFMNGEQLAGLISLTKGAYFEKLVESDTEGYLHEHFNHSDTDITIDGIEYQIKATDSVSYISSVDPDIPVIATTEVAEKTNVIDSGYSNEELTESVQLALGGTMIDVGDTAVDAILTGVGSLGVFSTIRGINHSSDQIKNGADKDVAILEGVEVAITGTVKGIVDTAELAYNVASSAPSRAVGRGLCAVTKFSGKVIGKAL